MDNERFQELVLKQLLELSEGQKKLDSRITSIQDRLDAVQGQASMLHKHAETTQEQITALHKQNKNLQDRLDALHGQVGTVQNNINTLQGDVANLQGQAAKMETWMENDVADKLQAMLEGQQTHVAVLERIEKKIDAIFEQVGIHEVQIRLLKK